MKRSDYPLSWSFRYGDRELVACMPCPEIDMGVVTHGSGENETWPARFVVTPEGDLQAFRVQGFTPEEQAEWDDITKAAQKAAEALVATKATPS